MLQSVFKDTEIYESYDVELTFIGRLAGSLPSEPQAIWEMVHRRMLQSQGKNKREIDKEDLIRQVRLFLEETGKDIGDIKDDDIEEMAKKKQEGGVNVFRRDADGLWFPSHAIKAAIKETVNTLYAGERWGKREGYAGKGPKNFTAERVFIRPGRLRLLREGAAIKDTDGTQMLHGTVEGPRGPRSIVTEHEFVDQPTIQFTLDVLKNGKAAEEMRSKWPEIFSHMESNGIGSHRRYTDYGRFVTIKFSII